MIRISAREKRPGLHRHVVYDHLTYIAQQLQCCVLFQGLEFEAPI